MYFGHIYKIASGQIIGSVQSPAQDDLMAQVQGSPTLGVEIVDAFIDPNSNWVNDLGQIVSRQAVAATLDKTDIAADGVDIATLSGLPDPCWLVVNGGEVEVTGGRYQITSNAPADIRCEIIGQYSGGPWIVGAHALATLKEQVKNRIDAAAEACRLKYITAGSGQAMVYQAKANEAKAYLAATSPVDADYPLLGAEAAVRGLTAATLAQSVAALAAQWLAVAAEIESLRLGAKDAVSSSANVAAVLATEQINWP